MPTNRRRRPQLARAGGPQYGEQHIRYLLDGVSPLKHLARGFYPVDQFGFVVGQPDPDLAAVRIAWERLRDRLLGDYVDQFPGRRPHGWWLVDAPAPRRKMIAGPSRLYVDRRGWLNRWWFGVPCVFGGDDFKTPVVFESQAVYLARYGLLLDSERRKLGESYPREQVLLDVTHEWRSQDGN